MESLFSDIEMVTPLPKKNLDWSGNVQSQQATMGVKLNWKRDYLSQRKDFYATEPKAAKLLLKLTKFSNIWECACGAGHLAEVFDAAGLLARISDIEDYGIGAEIIDFLRYDGKWAGDIITNPPYKFSTKFAYKAMSILEAGRKLAMFLPQRYLSGKERRKLFEAYPPYKIWASSGRMECGMNGVFKGSSAVDYCWFVWVKGYDGETKLGWFN
ncbi:hypothetical protein FACS189434_06590 [Bacteroidia bacterium]|nr:hypothetical protein FACS189434_06590 [Bacteroidia bacterium]